MNWQKRPTRSACTPKYPAFPCDNSLDVHPVLLESIDGIAIRSAAIRTNGSAGPSGLDAVGWKRLCTSFQSPSADLCNSLALVAKRICTTYVEPQGIAPLTACRLITLDKSPGVRLIGVGETARRIIGKAIIADLCNSLALVAKRICTTYVEPQGIAPLTACCLIALDKSPGVRPIGVGETARRIIGKAIIAALRTDIQEAAGSIQLCGGQEAGSEAAIHAKRHVFDDPDS